MNSNLKVLAEQYQIIIEKRVQPEPSTEESFEQFLKKRLAGAEKIAKSSEHKSGFATLTAIHYEAKLKPYAESHKWATKEDRNAHYKEMAKKVYAKLANIDKLSQEQFQSLMGELEVWGEVYIRSTKPNSLKI